MKCGGKKFDVIICADDQALNFVLGLGKELFAGVPIVFCSVSGWKFYLGHGSAGGN